MRVCKNFDIIGENLMYKGSRLVIKSAEDTQQIISDIHQGTGNNCKAKSMASHRGRDTTYQEFQKDFFDTTCLEILVNL